MAPPSRHATACNLATPHCPPASSHGAAIGTSFRGAARLTRHSTPGPSLPRSATPGLRKNAAPVGGAPATILALELVPRPALEVEDHRAVTRRTQEPFPAPGVAEPERPAADGALRHRHRAPRAGGPLSRGHRPPELALFLARVLRRLAHVSFSRLLVFSSSRLLVFSFRSPPPPCRTAAPTPGAHTPPPPGPSGRSRRPPPGGARPRTRRSPRPTRPRSPWSIP